MSCSGRKNALPTREARGRAPRGARRKSQDAFARARNAERGASSQPVTHSADRFDTGSVAGQVDFPAQTPDQNVDRVAHRLFALAPGLLQDLLAGEDSARPPQETLEDRELARRQGERFAAAGGRAAPGVEARGSAGAHGGGA